ncbi:MAG: peptidase S9, partial [Gemmatimonadetes bacterium]|nr:peptidase S9 [Gemmatimonadota bacterium]
MQAAIRHRSGAKNTVKLGLLGLFWTTLLLMWLATPVEAQYFGRNKVQYDGFEFQVLETPHFDIHYYPEAGVAIEDVARMAERWYERYARFFQHEFEGRKPLVMYADHPDFQQTNTLQSFLGESTGGVTESLKNRVIMPMTGSYQDTDHVLGHELVHAFQYNIAQSGQGGGLVGLTRLPLWLVEGMAEYLSVGREDPLTAMWMRDAVRRDDIPTIQQMGRDFRYFPYRFGQALWAYLAGVYGDDAVSSLFRSSLRRGWEPALAVTLGLNSDTLSKAWAETMKA